MRHITSWYQQYITWNNILLLFQYSRLQFKLVLFFDGFSILTSFSLILSGLDQLSTGAWMISEALHCLELKMLTSWKLILNWLFVSFLVKVAIIIGANMTIISKSISHQDFICYELTDWDCFLLIQSRVSDSDKSEHWIATKLIFAKLSSDCWQFFSARVSCLFSDVVTDSQWDQGQQWAGTGTRRGLYCHRAPH